MYLVAGGDEQAAYDEAQRLGLRLYRQTVTTRFEEILISGKSAGNRTHHRRSEP